MARKRKPKGDPSQLEGMQREVYESVVDIVRTTRAKKKKTGWGRGRKTVTVPGRATKNTIKETLKYVSRPYLLDHINTRRKRQGEGKITKKQLSTALEEMGRKEIFSRDIKAAASVNISYFHKDYYEGGKKRGKEAHLHPTTTWVITKTDKEHKVRSEFVNDLLEKRLDELKLTREEKKVMNYILKEYPIAKIKSADTVNDLGKKFGISRREAKRIIEKFGYEKTLVGSRVTDLEKTLRKKFGKEKFFVPYSYVKGYPVEIKDVNGKIIKFSVGPHMGKTLDIIMASPGFKNRTDLAHFVEKTVVDSYRRTKRDKQILKHILKIRHKKRGLNEIKLKKEVAKELNIPLKKVNVYWEEIGILKRSINPRISSLERNIKAAGGKVENIPGWFKSREAHEGTREERKRKKYKPLGEEVTTPLKKKRGRRKKPDIDEILLEYGTSRKIAGTFLRKEAEMLRQRAEVTESAARDLGIKVKKPKRRKR